MVREHRWISADEQIAMLKDDCRMIVSLDGGTKVHKVDRERLIKMAHAERSVRLVHAFFLADPAVRGLPQAKADFRSTLKLLVEKRGAIVECMSGELSTAKPGQLRAMIALGEKMLGRSRQGAKSAENGKQGNQEAEFSEAAWTDAKAIWRDLIEYPHWPDCVAAYRQLDKKYKHEDPFTVWRARLKWGKRRPAKAKR